jgi:hypothetical protein
MRNRPLAALVVIALVVRPAGAQAVLAPATDVDPAPAAPVRVGGPVIAAPVRQQPVLQEPLPQPAPELVQQQPPPEPFDQAPAGGGPLAREWQQFEYLLWWIRDTRLPTLITANRSGTVPALSAPGTYAVAGTSEIDSLDRSGGRFTVGCALDTARTIGVEGNYFFLGSRTTTVGTGSNAAGAPALGIPYYDVTTGTQQVQLVSFPHFARGNVTVTDSARLQGAEFNGVVNIAWDRWFQADGLIGFRYFEVDEGLQLAYSSDRFLGSGATGARFGAADQFDGHNRFYGGQLGLRLDFRKGLFFLNLTGKVALGDTYEVVRINGVSSYGLPGQPAHLLPGGTLAVASNSGRHARDAFAVMPEATVRVGVLLQEKVRLFVGYNFLYLSQLARPADQISQNANPTQIPLSTRMGLPFFGPAVPQFAFHGSEFWAQGLVLGVEYRY